MKERLQFIDGLRGLAVMLTVLCHTWLYGGMYRMDNSFGGGWSRWFATFTIGVTLFMVLSGFCLTYPLVRRDGWRDLDVGDYFRRRIVRIVPPYYAAIALFLLLAALLPPLYRIIAPAHRSSFFTPNPGVVAAHLLFSYNAASTLVPNMPSLDGSFWSIELEAQFYLLLPLLLLVARRWGVGTMVAGVAVLSSAVGVWVWYVVKPSGDALAFQFWSTFAPTRLLEFALGILAAVVAVRYGERIPARLSFAIAVALLWMGVVYCYVGLGHFHPLTTILVAGGCCGLLLAASRPGLAQRIFTFRPLAAVGLISYSIYLVHEPLVKELYSWLPDLQGWAAFAVYSLGFSLLMVGAGYVFYLLVERPALRWGKRLARRQPPPAPIIEAVEAHAAPLAGQTPLPPGGVGGGSESRHSPPPSLPQWGGA